MPKVYGFKVIVVQSLNKVGFNGENKKINFLSTRNVNCLLHFAKKIKFYTNGCPISEKVQSNPGVSKSNMKR